MYKITFASLTVPTTKQAGAAMVRRAGICLREKLLRTAPGACPIIDYHAEDGQVTITCESRKALLSLPRSIGSPVGHFGQFERTAKPLHVIDRLFQTVYGLQPFAKTYGPETRQRLTGEVAVRLFHHLNAQMKAFDVCANAGRNEIVVHFDEADHSCYVPATFNGVFSRSAILPSR